MQVLRKRLDPPRQNTGLRAEAHVVCDRLDKIRRRREVAGGEEVVDGFGGLLLRNPCLRGSPVQLGHQLRLQVDDSVAKERLEQVVISVPLSLRIQPDSKQVSVHQLPAQRTGVLDAGGVRRQLRREALQHRGLQNEVLDLPRLGSQHLLSQITEQLRRVGAALKRRVARLCGEDHSGHPSLRALTNKTQRLGVIRPAPCPPQGSELGIIEAELGFGHSQQLPSADLTEREGQRSTPNEHQVHRRRKVAQQCPDRLVALSVEEMHVIEHQHHIIGHRSNQLVAKLFHLVFDRPAELESRAKPGDQPLDPDGQMSKQVGRAAEPVIARKPNTRKGSDGQCLRDNRALTVAGPAEHRHQPTVHPGTHLFGQLWTSQNIPWKPGWKEARE